MIRLVAPLCALALLLTACGSKPADTGAQPLTPTTTSESPPASSSTSVPPSTSPGVPRCSAAALSGTIQPADSGAGNRYATLVVTAKSGCTLYGYGGLQLVDAQGKPAPTNLIRTPNPGPALVSLQPGQTAHKTLHWTVVPTGDEPVTGPCEPPAAAATVIPPDETQPFTVIYEFGPVCDHGRIEGSAYVKP